MYYVLPDQTTVVQAHKMVPEGTVYQDPEIAVNNKSNQIVIPVRERSYLGLPTFGLIMIVQ